MNLSADFNADPKKIAFLRKKLKLWFALNQRSFPWRNQQVTPFETMISEILLQRTKAETVAAFFPVFFEKYQSWEHLNQADLKSLEDLLKPLGLYRHRAKRLKKIADLWTLKKGIAPKTTEELKDYNLHSLYLSNAFSLFFLHKKTPLLDVNMSRILHRYFGIPSKKDVRLDKTMLKLATLVVNTRDCNSLNWAFLDYAALVCKARNPLCDECVLQFHCHYFQNKQNA